MGNPAIFVPELKTLIYGVESFWGAIESPDHLREITNNDISSQWYIQALKMFDKAAPQEGGE